MEPKRINREITQANPETTISLTLEQYNHFISLEARVCAAVEYISRSDYPKAEEILGIIGTDHAIEVANRIDVKDKTGGEISS